MVLTHRSPERPSYEHVGEAVRIRADEVRGEGEERDVAPIGRDRWDDALVVALVSVGADPQPLGLARDAVVHEHVGEAVRVRADEVRGEGDERDVA